VLIVSALWFSQNLSAHDRCQWVASSQELLSSYTSDKELFCCHLQIGYKLWIYHWDSLNELEFIQCKDVDCPTFTSICNSAINSLDYGSSFSGIQTDCLWQTISILERQLLVSNMQNQYSSYFSSWSRNTDESCHLEFDFFMTVHQRTSHWLLGKLSATVNLFNWTILPTVQTWLPVIIPNKKSEVPSSWNLTDDESLTITVKAWFESQNRKFYFQGINSWEEKLKKCTDVAGAYVEKWQYIYDIIC